MTRQDTRDLTLMCIITGIGGWSMYITLTESYSAAMLSLVTSILIIAWILLWRHYADRS